MEALYDLAEIKKTDDIQKYNRPSEIIKSEKSFVKIHNIITQENLNPFDPSIDSSQLYDLSSAMPVEGEITESTPTVLEKGETLYEEFVNERIRSTETKIHEAMKRQK